jgi:hypothetical protein
MVSDELAEVLRPVIPSLAEEIIAAIRHDVADYARPLTGDFGRNVRLGVERAFERFFDERGDDGRLREVYVELGRGEFREGRSLDALLSAYRLGARLSWRRFVEAGKAANTAPDDLYELGEAIFAYIEGLSAESIEGYTAAQSLAAGERARERRRLVRLLIQESAADERVVGAAAQAAGWRLPASLAALVAEDPDADALASRLGAGVIATEGDELTVALVPDPAAPGRRAQLARALGDTRAALGPALRWEDAAASLARARLGLRLIADGTLAGPFEATDDHLLTLLLHADPLLARDVASAALAPLDVLAPGPRRKLEATLRAWLDGQGRVEAVAAGLGVHAQTVRYRLNRLRELLGASLEEPEGRFALALALRLGAATE